MKTTLVGEKAKITSNRVAEFGQVGFVTWDGTDKNGIGPVMISFDGNKPTSFPIEMTSLYHEPEPVCHYCGMPAKSFGFFDEPVCSDCGGH